MLEPEESGDEICGAVMSKRKNGDRIAIWNRRNNARDVILQMGKQIKVREKKSCNHWYRATFILSIFLSFL